MSSPGQRNRGDVNWRAQQPGPNDRIAFVSHSDADCVAITTPAMKIAVRLNLLIKLDVHRNFRQRLFVSVIGHGRSCLEQGQAQLGATSQRAILFAKKLRRPQEKSKMKHLARLATARSIVIGIAAAVAFMAVPALADEGEHGPKVEVHDNGKDYKYEYKDGRCKYEYKLNYRTGEEKVEQKGDCRGVSPRRALYHSEDPIVLEERDYDYDVGTPSVRRTACNRQMIGTVLGGVAGGIAGSHVGHGDGRKVATVAGAIIGAVIGGNIGRRMDRADNGCAYQALEFASPGETVFWRNPNSNIEYSITPSRLSRRSDGRECREYKTSVVGGGDRPVKSSDVACRRSDGSWEIE